MEKDDFGYLTIEDLAGLSLPDQMVVLAQQLARLAAQLRADAEETRKQDEREAKR